MNNILVFPCGSEVALEIFRSIKFSRHFRLFGGSSVDDHGKFVFDDYIDGIPFHSDPDFIRVLANVVRQYNIDAIYPAMDEVAVTIKNNEHFLGCRVIGSSANTTSVCASKILTYNKLFEHFPVPKWCLSTDDVNEYPIFIKSDIGYGSRDICLAQNKRVADEFITKKGVSNNFIFCEYLPGSEYTVDCFSSRHGELIFSGLRLRARISNGISVNTKIVEDVDDLFESYAEKINLILKPRGAWFFQMKLDMKGNPKLLEVAARLAGSSSLFRAKGINFALLSVFDAFGIDVSILKNGYSVELDRALNNKYSLDIEYNTIYLDYDDCLLIRGKINISLMSFIFLSINHGKKIILITRHAGDIYASLEKHRITSVFDKVIHLDNQEEKKSEHILPSGAIFIDDSYAERMDVLEKHKIPVFSPDMVEALI